MNETGQHPDEKRFEDYIEKYLNSIGFKSIKYNNFDRNLCLLTDEFLSFIKNSQPNEYKQLIEQFGDNTDKTIIKKLSENISKYGLVHSLRNRLSSRGVHLNTFFRSPKSSHNQEHLDLYKKNIFSLVRQLHFSPNSEQSVDICLFLNGIPLLTLELKNQLTGQNIRNAENQYRFDRDPKEKLFNFQRCLVHFAVDNDNVSMTTKLSGSKTRFLPYNKDIPNPKTNGYKSEYLWNEILTPESLSDIIENFIHVSNDEEQFFNNITKKIEIKKTTSLIFPRYHQLDVVKQIKKEVKKDGAGNNYLIQHTTGSGKSFEIGWLAHSLTSLYQKDTDDRRIFDTIIVISDRKVLDKQLQNTIKSLAQTLGVVKAVDESSDQLKRYLEDGKDIVITTIQKFPFISDTISSLGDKKFAVIIDEVHSSQSGERSKDLKKALSKLKIEISDYEDLDYEDYIRAEIKSRGKQKHISFFGFTGTPKQKTLELFGTKANDGKFYPFHSYTMYQSIHENFTLDVLQHYTTFKRYFKIKQKSNDDIEIPSSEGKKKLIKFADSHPKTIQQKSGIIIDHFTKLGSKEIQGKARGMIVVKSRLDCVKFFYEINKQLKEMGLNYRSLVAFSGEKEGQTENSLNKTIEHEGDIPLGLKNPKFRLLIVSNKFQTGFDEPLVQSMYVDKKLDGVQCVQTLSRLNRSYSGKERTFVLDFINEISDVVESFQKYYTTTLLTDETEPDKLYEYETKINSFNLFTEIDINNFNKIFFDKNRNEGDLQPLLNISVEAFERIQDKKTQDEFRSIIQSFMRLYSYISQIMKFSDEGIEKLFIFLRYLNKKLPKNVNDKIDISSSIDLDSLRIQKTFEGRGELEKDKIGELNPHDFGVVTKSDDINELLSELIITINERFGKILTQEDKLDLKNLNKRITENKELIKIMNGDSSETNKQEYFNKTIEKILLSYVNDRFSFYKKMEEPTLKNFVTKSLYENYKR